MPVLGKRHPVYEKIRPDADASLDAPRVHRRQQWLDDRSLLVAGVRRIALRPIFHPARVDQGGEVIMQTRRPFSTLSQKRRAHEGAAGRPSTVRP